MNRRNLLRSFGASVTASLGAPYAAALSTDASTPDAVIKVGQSAVFSGTSAGLGMEMRDGIDAYFKTVNAQGGLTGRKLQLVSLDDGYEPERAAANTAKLINEERVFALLGYVGTPTSNAALPVFTASRVPFIGAFTGANSLRNPFNKYIFNIRASYGDEGVPIVNQLTSLGSSKVAIFYQNDAYGLAVRTSIEQALAAKGMRAVALASVERNSIDVSSAVDILLKSGANSIAMGSVYGSSAELVKAFRAQGSTAQFVSVSFIGTSMLLEKVGESAKGIGISQVMPYPGGLGLTPIAREYQRAMRDAGQSKFNYGSME